MIFEVETEVPRTAGSRRIACFLPSGPGRREDSVGIRTRALIAVAALVTAGLGWSQAADAAAVKPTVSITQSRTHIDVGGHVTISGKVSPNQHGRNVHLQRFYGGHWHNLGGRKLTATSRYSFRLKISRKGTFTYRVHDYAHPGWKSASSRKIHVRVTKPSSSGGGGGTSSQCHPLTNAGNCYEPGEFCRDSDHWVIGVAGDGERIQCLDNNGWRWEPI
jgi:hypothetical protein